PAVSVGPCSGVIGATNGPCDSRLSASNSRVDTVTAPAASIAAVCWSSRSAFRAASTTDAPGASRTASSVPISLRPPRISTVCAPVSSTGAIITCASVSGGGELPRPAGQRRAGVSDRAPSRDADHSAPGQFAPCGGGGLYLRPQDAHRPGDHDRGLAESGHPRGGGGP